MIYYMLIFFLLGLKPGTCASWVLGKHWPSSSSCSLYFPDGKGYGQGFCFIFFPPFPQLLGNPPLLPYLSILGPAFLFVLEKTISQQISCSSSSKNISEASFIIFSKPQLRSFVLQMYQLGTSFPTLIFIQNIYPPFVVFSFYDCVSSLSVHLLIGVLGFSSVWILEFIPWSGY